MDFEEPREFGDYVEECKRSGVGGSNRNGDFTYGALQDKAREFRGEKS